MKKFVLLSFVLLLAGFTAANAQSGNAKLKVGATPIPHADLLKLIKPDLAAQGIDLEVVEFTDYVTPNLALNDKSLDANFFQHQPYLDTFNRERGLKLVSAAGIHVEPLGLYSQKVKDIKDLKNRASIAIPNDPTNEGRALLLLQANGLIKLSDKAGLEGTPKDIISNPKNLVFRELEAAQLPRVLKDVDAAIINGNYAIDAKLNPVKDSLIIEDAQSPYVNIVTVRADNLKDPKIVALINALRTPKVKKFIDDNYGGGVVAVF